MGIPQRFGDLTFPRVSCENDAVRQILRTLFRLRLTQLLRRHGFRVPWVFEEVEQEWFGGPYLNWDGTDVERAFNLATRVRGLDWVLGRQLDVAAFPRLPGIGPRGGFSEFIRVYWFGIRLTSILGAAGAERLIARLIANDSDASEEASAIHLLRNGQPNVELDVEPCIEVGTRSRNPDFRIRRPGDPWVYAEVTRLHGSSASDRVLELLGEIVNRMMAVERPFVLEILLNREPTVEEVEVIVREAMAACGTDQGCVAKVADVASILVKSGDPSVIVPTPISDDKRPRLAISRAVVGLGRPNRQLVARVPFADERAEDILHREARQLPKDECGLVMVNVNLQPTAFESWSERIPERFTSDQHTRVAAVILFMYATSITDHGPVWIPHVRLLPNPHAAVPLPAWILQRVTDIRDKTRGILGRSD